MEVCFWALLFMPLVILHHLLNVSVQLANKRGFKQKQKKILCRQNEHQSTIWSSLLVVSLSHSTLDTLWKYVSNSPPQTRISKHLFMSSVRAETFRQATDCKIGDHFPVGAGFFYSPPFANKNWSLVQWVAWSLFSLIKRLELEVRLLELPSSADV
jgi:hypothetical protein